MLWWIPLITALFFAMGLIYTHLWHQRRNIDRVKLYRARYWQVISGLESITISVNTLGELTSNISEVKVLDYYESCLKILETLLLTVKKIRPFGSESSSLNSVIYLITDCNNRINRTKEAFQSNLKGKNVDLHKLYGQTDKTPLSGCYFCSKPLTSNRSSLVKVKIDGMTKKVVSCTVCRDELQHNKKIKVLHFIKDGKPLHWSEVAEYKPTEDYWNINSPKLQKKTTKLTVVAAPFDEENPIK